MSCLFVLVPVLSRWCDGLKSPTDSVSVQLHQPFALVPNAPNIIADLDEKLHRANEDAQAWFTYWDEYYEGLGVPKGSFLREACTSSLSLELIAVDGSSDHRSMRCRVSRNFLFDLGLIEPAYIATRAYSLGFGISRTSRK